MGFLSKGALGALFLGSSAYANPFTIYGAGPAGQALGGAITAQTEDSFAAFYNPAGLGFLENGEITLQFLTINPNLQIQRLDPDTDTSIQDAVPASTFGLNIGATIPIIPKKLMAGMALYMPQGINLLNAQSLDPQRPQFYMYQSLHDRFELVPAISYRPIPEVSLGAGVELSAVVGATLSSIVLGVDPATNNAILQRDLVADAKIIASPIIGTTIAPIEQLKLGFSFKGKNDGSIGVVADVQTEDPNLADLTLSTNTVIFFVPTQISFGASFDLTPQISLMASVDRDFWSKAENPETIVATTVNVNGNTALTLDTAEVALNFIDTTTPRFGVEISPIEEVKIRAGYFFRPTHVPNQTQPESNFLDGDIHGVSFGAAGELKNTLLTNDLPIKLEVSYQLQAMAQGVTGKEDPNDPVGDLAFGGQIHSLFFALSQKF